MNNPQVRKLRASIADLSDENDRNLNEVERRGLLGGVNLVRRVKEEIRELEFQLLETNSRKAACQAQLEVLRSPASLPSPESSSATVSQSDTGHNTNDNNHINSDTIMENGNVKDEEDTTESTSLTKMETSLVLSR